MAKTHPSRDITLADVGCGYGALAHYIAADRQFDDVTYTGYDISLDLINECQSRFDNPRFRFVLGTRPEAPTTCVVMSGTYNLAATPELAIWEDYVTECLQNCWRKTSHAMIFNLQVAPKAYIARDSIYYAHSDNILELCHKRFGPTTITVDRNLSNDATFCVTKQP